MNPLFDFLFSQYSGYNTLDIVLELVAGAFTIASVVYSKKNNVLVFPTGMICTAIFVYLLLKWGLLGDMIINGYYFIMSIYGWHLWTRKKDGKTVIPISKTTKKQHLISLGIFIITFVFVFIVYAAFDKFNHWSAYLDTITTALFFVAMWLMAKRKIENWIYWIIGDIITVPLYFYKGLTFSSILYFVLTIIAIYGYLAWKKNLNKIQAVV
ncbi:nicotinamide riboside transporter PnuC [Flavobacteriaceae bacterium]|nr:nicotinamide riboside transporter PnuC [Flavobacteriaceae bacterium]MDB2630720.1 nicotinamide riboside transporter PnuC [Ulvibacter sp.]MDB3934877.1 nicotinamide riboside transporter PnuC [Flavobacteriaceae bacterium]MDB9859003.1 nicotinamide riboside transporter PnuC [Flavobacteriaceae bacterium]MDC1362816.1 nicotinamide riboside transporter PnuC [Flavobacteriaceae bacterium]